MNVTQKTFELRNSSKYTTLGCSPVIISELLDWLKSMREQISSIDVAIYLFNSKVLYQALKDLALSGIKVTVYSIPLDGYDHKYAKQIVDADTSDVLGSFSKYDLAQDVYNQYLMDSPANMTLRIVNHIYLRSPRVQPFSRGNMPYSLHCKTCCVRFKNQSVYTGITSSNLAVRDEEKHELAVLLRLNQSAEITSALDFFAGLYENSHEYIGNECTESISSANVPIKLRPVPKKSRMMYTAPFYDNSAQNFEDNISTMVRNAQNRIIVCAQHICSYEYSYERAYTASNAQPGTIRRNGFLKDVLEKARGGIPTTFLSQTYVEDGITKKYRTPQNVKAFKDFVSAARETNCSYYVNPYLHAKYIIIDDTVIVTTCNFTPSQFIYLPNVEINHFENMSGSYAGIFCEFGVYAVITNKDFAQWLVDYTNKIEALSDKVM